MTTLIQFGACVAFVAGTLGVQAVAIYSTYDGIDTTPPPSWPIYRYQNGEWYGHRLGSYFVTDGQMYLLDSITLYVERNGVGSSTFMLDLYSDEAGLPGTLSGSLIYREDIGEAGNYTFGGNGLLLSPNTVYWVVGEAHTGMGHSYNWYGGTSQEQNIAAASALMGSGAWSGWGVAGSTPLAMVVEASPVPEPSAWAIIGLGLFMTLRLSHRKGRT